MMSFFNESVDVTGSLENRERRLKLLEDRKVRYHDSQHCEFEADETLIGLIIGKQGEKLIRVAKEYKVEIRVLPDDGGRRRVRIYGNDISNVHRARTVLEYVYEEYYVDKEMGLWLSNQRCSCIKEITVKAGLHSAWFDEHNLLVLFCGLRRSIEMAIHLLKRRWLLYSGNTEVEEPIPFSNEQKTYEKQNLKGKDKNKNKVQTNQKFRNCKY